MATLEELVVRISADVSQLKRGLRDAERASKSSSNRMGRSFTGLSKGVAGARRAVLGLKTALVGLGVAAVSVKTIQLADSYKLLQSRLRLVTSGSANLAAVQKELVDLAQDTRTDLEGTVRLYSRVARNTRDLGKSQREMIDFVRAASQAIQISGATAQEAEGGIIQFSQGLTDLGLASEEFRSVSENLPRLLQAIADGAGVSIGKLKQLAGEGKLTPDFLFRSLENQAETLEAEFKQIERTVGQAFVQIRNQLLLTIGEIDSTEGATEGLGKSLDDLRKIISDPAFGAGLRALLIGIAEAANLATTALGGLGLFLQRVGLVEFQVSIAPKPGDTKEVQDAIEAIRGLEQELDRLKREREALTQLEGPIGFFGLESFDRALEATKQDVDKAIERIQTRIPVLVAAINKARGGGGEEGDGLDPATPPKAKGPTKEQQKALESVQKQIQALNDEATILAANRTERDKLGTVMKAENVLRAVGLKLTEDQKAELETLSDTIKNFTVQDTIDDLTTYNDQLDRLLDASLQGEAAFARVSAAIEAENVALAENVPLLSAQGKALQDAALKGMALERATNAITDAQSSLQGLRDEVDLLRAGGDARREAAVASAQFHAELVKETEGLENQRAIVGGLVAEFDQLSEAKIRLEEAQEAIENMEAALREVGDAVGDAFGRLIFEGEKLTDVLRDLMQQISQMIFQRGVVDPLVESFAGLGGSVAGLFGGATEGAAAGAGEAVATEGTDAAGQALATLTGEAEGAAAALGGTLAKEVTEAGVSTATQTAAQSAVVGALGSLTAAATSAAAALAAVAGSSTGAAVGSVAAGAATGAADGGQIFGPGTGTSDSIPAMLSRGEFVVNAQDTQKNLALLKAINEGRTPVQRFAHGGFVPSAGRVRGFQDGGMVEGAGGGGFVAGDIINHITMQPMPGQPQPRVDPVQIGATVGRMTRDAQRRGISG